MNGCLVVMVGASGAGKDSLLRWLAQHLHGAVPVRIAQRWITRAAHASEDHLALDAARFEAMRAAGDFALHWTAHGTGYGIGIRYIYGGACFKRFRQITASSLQQLLLSDLLGSDGLDSGDFYCISFAHNVNTLQGNGRLQYEILMAGPGDDDGVGNISHETYNHGCRQLFRHWDCVMAISIGKGS